MKEIKTKIPLYGGKIAVKFYTDKTEAEMADWYNIPDLSRFDAVALSKNNSPEYLILAHAYRLTPGIIAHESKHILNYIFIDKGIKLDPANDEPECYLLSWIVNRVYEAVKKNNLKVKGC